MTNSTSNDGSYKPLWTVLVGIVLLGGISRLIDKSYQSPSASNKRSAQVVADRRESAKKEVTLRLQTVLPNVQPRLKVESGDTLDLYLSREDFETVAFPDREEFVERLGRAWCENIKGGVSDSLRLCLPFTAGQSRTRQKTVPSRTSLENRLGQLRPP